MKRTRSHWILLLLALTAATGRSKTMTSFVTAFTPPPSRNAFEDASGRWLHPRCHSRNAAPFHPMKLASGVTVLYNQRGRNDDDDGTAGDKNNPLSLIDVVDRAGAILAQPLPIIQVAAGWIVVLLVQAVIAGVVPAIVATIFFGALRTVGRSVIVFEETIEEDVYGIEGEKSAEEQEKEETLQFQIDGTSLVLSIFSAQLLVPDDWTTSSAEVLPILALLILVAVVVSEGVQQIEQEEQLSKDDKLLNRWDEKYRQQQTKTKRRQDDEL